MTLFILTFLGLACTLLGASSIYFGFSNIRGGTFETLIAEAAIYDGLILVVLGFLQFAAVRLIETADAIRKAQRTSAKKP